MNICERRLMVGLLALAGTMTVASVHAGSMPGLLVVHPDNLRYFMVKGDPAKKAVWMSWVGASSEPIFSDACHAEIVSPGGESYLSNPPIATGKKVVITDSDHFASLRVTHPWVWKSFARGLQPILMDCKYQGLTWWNGKDSFEPEHDKWQNMRDALGVTLACSRKMNLTRLVPQAPDQATPASTRYCLHSRGKEYLVYQPASEKAFTLEIPSGRYRLEWIHPQQGVNKSSSLEWKGGVIEFTAPFPGDSALHLVRTVDLTRQL